MRFGFLDLSHLETGALLIWPSHLVYGILSSYCTIIGLEARETLWMSVERGLTEILLNDMLLSLSNIPLSYGILVLSQ